jgi:tetratricopeptide (TPR) repeat protein
LNIKKIVFRKKRPLDYFKVSFFSLLFFLISLKSYAQDSIPEAKDFTEENELKFQEFFFEALSQKSIGNHQKAIENLESCNQIVPNDVAVFFEFSKNYLALNKTLLAKEYIQRAIEKEVTNIWMQKHLIAVFVKENNFLEAIKVQQKIVLLNSNERGFLVRLYLQNRDYKSALSLMNTLEKEHLLSLKLKGIKDSLVQRKPTIFKEKRVSEDVFKKFETDKSYMVLKQILEVSKDTLDQLLKYSSEGISLFPAQPFVYLINGKALNAKKEYKIALQVLKNGLDFVFEDAMEANFYKEISLSYMGLGNKEAADKYREKIKKLKN